MANEMQNQTGGNNWWQGQQQQQSPQAPANPWGQQQQQAPTSGYGSMPTAPQQAPVQQPTQPPGQPPAAPPTPPAAPTQGGWQQQTGGFGLDSSMRQMLEKQMMINKWQGQLSSPQRGGFQNYAGPGGSMMDHIRGRDDARKSAEDRRLRNQNRISGSQQQLQNALMNLKGNYGSLEEMQGSFGDVYNRGYVSDPSLFQSGEQRRMGGEYDSIMAMLPALWGSNA